MVAAAVPYIGVDHSAPGELKKEGASYDLPIAVGLLLASKQLEASPSLA
jgi:predicted ATPase with chaperone activity